MAEYTQISVRAVPVDPHQPAGWYLLDCTHCGIMGAYARADVDPVALTHLGDHGVDTSGFFIEPPHPL